MKNTTTKVKLLGPCGYRSLVGLEFPIIVEADLYKGHYYVKKGAIPDAKKPSAPTLSEEIGEEYVFFVWEVEEV